MNFFRERQDFQLKRNGFRKPESSVRRNGTRSSHTVHCEASSFRSQRRISCLSRGFKTSGKFTKFVKIQRPLPFFSDSGFTGAVFGHCFGSSGRTLELVAARMAKQSEQAISDREKRGSLAVVLRE